MGQTSFRGHDFYLGLFMELEKSIINVKGKHQVEQTSIRSNTNEMIDGGLNRSSDEGTVMDLERRVGVIQLELPFTTSVKERRIDSNSTKSIPITKKMVWIAYKKVKSNKGSGGVDFISMKDYEVDLENNLYKLWNRLSSGSYFPLPVREKGIPKKDGKIRMLGIPSISDRIAQQVIKDYLEPRLEVVFHKWSYGYRPGLNAHHALEQVRQNVRKFEWVIDMDIKGFFDEVSHELLQKAIEKHVSESWVKLYIQRWLEAPVQRETGELMQKEGRGTPQGGVISPLLSNLFLHYVFDRWMEVHHKDVMFVRYADDIIVHCKSKTDAEEVLASIDARMQECHLRLHETKTKIAFCKRGRRWSSHKVISFDFLGYSFMPRSTGGRHGMFLGFDCAISKSSQSKIVKTIKATRFQRWTERSIQEVADYFNPKLRGWINYYGKFRKWKLNRIFKLFNARLTNWVRNRFKKLNKSYIKACEWLRAYKSKDPNLFVHWQAGFINS